MSEEKRSQSALSGERIAFTGKLASMTRQQASQLVRSLGGTVESTPSEVTTLVVFGQDGWPLQADGRLTRKLERAQALADAGERLEIIQESAFLERAALLEATGNVHRTFTITQLGRLLDVSRSELQRWIRIGLINPVRTVHRLSYFDFQQVAYAKALCELIRSGISKRRIRQSLEQVKGWLPGVESTLAQLPLVERAGNLFVRLDDGRFAEPNGQLVFDFLLPEDAADKTAAVIDVEPRSVDGWFELALHREDAGRFDAARRAYLEALRLGGPDPELCFNLANVLYALERKDQALDRFRQCVELDAQYVEAWNNLGNVLTEQGETDESMGCFRKALEIEPEYADAHYNLAEALFQHGHPEEACEHWEAYLRQDPNSSWAGHVRERLRSAAAEHSR